MYHDVSLKLIHGFADSGLPEYCTIFHLPHPFVRMSQASHHTFSPVSDDLDLTFLRGPYYQTPALVQSRF